MDDERHYRIGRTLYWSVMPPQSYKRFRKQRTALYKGAMIRFVDDVALYTDLQVDISFALLYYLDMIIPNRILSRSSTTFH